METLLREIINEAGAQAAEAKAAGDERGFALARHRMSLTEPNGMLRAAAGMTGERYAEFRAVLEDKAARRRALEDFDREELARIQIELCDFVRGGAVYGE